MENNIFTPKIVDLILPGCSIDSKGEVDEQTNASKSTNFESNASGSMNMSRTMTSSNMQNTGKTGKGDSGQELVINLKKFNHLFLVMELGELDFKTLFDTVP